MQNWLRDGYLPPNLPLRREFETEFVTLKELQDAHPDAEALFFLEPEPADLPSASSSRPESPAPVVENANAGPSPWIPVPNVLLPPTSLLQQPRYFGPPALFFTTRGGHSTAIVDARGRSVLKGRVMWSNNDPDETETYSSSLVLGDVKRIEAFDTRDRRAVVVALRQGGLEAVDMGEALFQPGDESRPFFPMFVSPSSSTGRRKNWIWYLGGAVEDVSTHLSSLGSLGNVQQRRETALGRRSLPASQKRPATVGASSGSTLNQQQQQNRKRRDTEAREREDGRNAPRSTQLSTSLSPDEDILFLGRNRDRVYMCERNADSFRILRLSPLE